MVISHHYSCLSVYVAYPSLRLHADVSVEALSGENRALEYIQSVPAKLGSWQDACSPVNHLCLSPEPVLRVKD